MIVYTTKLRRELKKISKESLIETVGYLIWQFSIIYLKIYNTNTIIN